MTEGLTEMPKQINWQFKPSERSYWGFNEIVHYNQDFNAHTIAFSDYQYENWCAYWDF
jgi:hypothetical protein